MKKYILIAVIAIASCCLWACTNKSNNNPPSYSTLIVGKWLIQSDHIKIYTLTDNTLVKDTTISYTDPANNQYAWLFIFNANGSSYITDATPNLSGLVDTTSSLHYSISGKNLVYTEVGDNTQNTEPILQLNNTNFELSTTYNTTPNLFYPDLDANTTYKFVEDTYYKRQ